MTAKVMLDVVQMPVLGVAEPGVAAGPGRPVEPVAVVFRELVPPEGRPVPMAEPLPQGAREGRENGPDPRPEPDAPEQADTGPGGHGKDRDGKGDHEPTQDERPGRAS